MTWSQWVTKLRVASSRRRKWVRRTGGSGCSSWPTPRAGECGNDSGSAQRLQSGPNPGLKTLASQLWSTPRAVEYKETGTSQKAMAKGFTTLDEQARQSQMWQTPTQLDAAGRDYTYPNGNHETPFLTLPGQADLWAKPRAADGDKQTGRSDQRRDVGPPDALTGQAELWATSTTQDAENDGSPSQAARNSPPLNQQAIWQTPRARQQADCPSERARNSPALETEAVSLTGPLDPPTGKRGKAFLISILSSLQRCRERVSGVPHLNKLRLNLARFARETFGTSGFGRGKLNHFFVRWLMGAGATGLTGSGDWETRSCRLRDAWRSSLCGSPCLAEIAIQQALFGEEWQSSS